jgi:hypothetical protein
LTCRARFYYNRRNNKYLALRDLAEAEASSGALDVMLACHRYTLMAKLSWAASTAVEDVTSFAMSEKYLTTAQRHDTFASQTQAAFWTELRHRKVRPPSLVMIATFRMELMTPRPSLQPDFEKLHRIALRMNLATTTARDSYHALLRMRPNSPQVLRLFGSFLIDIINDRWG